MSDTTLFGRTVLSGVSKKMLLYASTAFCLACTGVGTAFISMKPTEWDAMTPMNRWGWSFLLIANVAGTVTNTVKAFYSTDNKPTP